MHFCSSSAGKSREASTESQSFTDKKISDLILFSFLILSLKVSQHLRPTYPVFTSCSPDFIGFLFCVYHLLGCSSPFFYTCHVTRSLVTCSQWLAAEVLSQTLNLCFFSHFSHVVDHGHLESRDVTCSVCCPIGMRGRDAVGNGISVLGTVVSG